MTRTVTSWTLEFQGHPPSPNDRMNRWEKARAMKEWRTSAYARCLIWAVPKCKRIKVSVVVVRRSLGVADWDNDVARMKPIIDGIVDAGVIPNDNRGAIVWGNVTEERGPKGLRVTVEAI